MGMGQGDVVKEGNGFMINMCGLARRKAIPHW